MVNYIGDHNNINFNNKNNHKKIEPIILNLKEFKIDLQGDFNIFGTQNHIKW